MGEENISLISEESSKKSGLVGCVNKALEKAHLKSSKDTRVQKAEKLASSVSSRNTIEGCFRSIACCRDRSVVRSTSDIAEDLESLFSDEAVKTKQEVKKREVVLKDSCEKLAMLIHARDCRVKEYVNVACSRVRNPNRYKVCEDTMCLQMKRWLRHLDRCSYRHCHFECRWLNKLSKHYRECTSAKCTICEPNRKEQAELAVFLITPVTLPLGVPDSIFSGYEGPDPFKTPLLCNDWRQGVPEVLRDHFRGKLEQAMVPKVLRTAVDVVKNLDTAQKAEEEAFKHAGGPYEYYARVALKIYAIVKDHHGSYDFTWYWQSFVPTSTRHEYVMRLFRFLRLADSAHRVSNEEELAMDLRLASSMEDFHFRAAGQMEVYFKRVNRHAQLLLKLVKEKAGWAKKVGEVADAGGRADGEGVAEGGGFEALAGAGGRADGGSVAEGGGLGAAAKAERTANAGGAVGELTDSGGAAVAGELADASISF